MASCTEIYFPALAPPPPPPPPPANNAIPYLHLEEKMWRKGDEPEVVPEDPPEIGFLELEAEVDAAVAGIRDAGEAVAARVEKIVKTIAESVVYFDEAADPHDVDAYAPASTTEIAAVSRAARNLERAIREALDELAEDVKDAAAIVLDSAMPLPSSTTTSTIPSRIVRGSARTRRRRIPRITASTKTIVSRRGSAFEPRSRRRGRGWRRASIPRARGVGGAPRRGAATGWDPVARQDAAAVPPARGDARGACARRARALHGIRRGAVPTRVRGGDRGGTPRGGDRGSATRHGRGGGGGGGGGARGGDARRRGDHAPSDAGTAEGTPGTDKQLPPKATMLPQRDFYARMRAHFDEDVPGTVTLKEAFEEFDEDGDGALNAEELRKLVAAAVPDATAREMRHFEVLALPGGDGVDVDESTVSLGELRAALRGSQRAHKAARYRASATGSAAHAAGVPPEKRPTEPPKIIGGLHAVLSRVDAALEAEQIPPKALFDAFDSDKDGKLDAAELKDMFWRLLPDFDADEVRFAMAHVFEHAAANPEDDVPATPAEGSVEVASGVASMGEKRGTVTFKTFDDAIAALRGASKEEP